jgi:hypothetical protein
VRAALGEQACDEPVLAFVRELVGQSGGPPQHASAHAATMQTPENRAQRIVRQPP